MDARGGFQDLVLRGRSNWKGRAAVSVSGVLKIVDNSHLGIQSSVKTLFCHGVYPC